MVPRWTFLLLLLILTGTSTVNSDTLPVPPPPDTAISWDVHRSLGVVLVFETEKGKLYFAHPVIVSRAVPDCQGIVIEEDLINITNTNTTGVPMRHVVLREPIAFRYEGGDWHSLVGRTFEK